MSNHPTSTRFRAALLSGVAVVLLSACMVTPAPLTLQDKQERVTQDKLLMFADIEPIKGPIGVEEAMARAIKYNLDHRVELMNEAVSNSQLELAHYDMLPKLAASAGYNSRDNDLAASSVSVRTHTQSLEPSISEDRGLLSGQLQLTWNVLDFGVSYIRARQMADRSLMADEQKRKVVQTIIQDVRYSYWRAVAAHRLLGRLDPLMKRVVAALADARKLEKQGVRAPLEDLQYQRALLGTLEQLSTLRRDLVAAKVQLGALMNVPPGTDFQLVIPKNDADLAVPRLSAKPPEMEQVALLNRPELNQAQYQSRVSHAETLRILLEMLPGVNLGVGGNYDSNSYAVNHTWANYGVNVAWNLLTLVSTPARLDLADANQKLVEMKRAALSMAVLAQVDVAWLRYQQALEEYNTARDQAEVEQRIFKHTRNEGAALQIGELPVIQAEADMVFAVLRRDITYANLQNAYGGILVSIGADPMPDAVANYQLGTLASAIATTLKAWENGSALTAALTTLKQGDPASATDAAKAADGKAAEGKAAEGKAAVGQTAAHQG